MSTLEHQYIELSTRFGQQVATSALAQWLKSDETACQLVTMPAITDNPGRLTAGSLTRDHLGSKVSFARVGAAGGNTRVSGVLSRIERAARANGMPGFVLLVGAESHGPLASHHEVIVATPRAQIGKERAA